MKTHFKDISFQGQTVPLILGEEQQLPSGIKKERTGTAEVDLFH